MELQDQLQSYIKQLGEELGISPIHSIRLSNYPTGSTKHNGGDFSIFMNQPSVALLKSHVQRVMSELPQASKKWPLQISDVSMKPESPFLELWLHRPTAFRYLCQNIADIHASLKLCEDSVVSGKRLLLVNAPEQNEFDSKKSVLMMTYLRKLCQFSGCKSMVYEGFGGQEEAVKINRGGDKSSSYYDESRKGFDLAKFIKDKQLNGKFDPSIGMVHEDSAAVGCARALERHLSTMPEFAICHVAPQSKSLLQQQIGLLLMIFGCRRHQSFVLHGGVDGAASSVQAYEDRIGIYISNQLRQKRVPGTDHVGKILRDTKLTFDFLGIKQQNRVKIPNLVQDSDSSSFEGKGGLFVQYTCSRLEGLLKEYDKAIIRNVYPACTPSNELGEEKMDWSLLSSGQEWSLWMAMLRFVDLLKSLREILFGDDPVSRIDVRAHSLCGGLLDLCREFSVFYSKVRILVEGQTHVFSTVECRIYFVGMLLKLIKCGLWLLNLSSVECM